MSIVTQAVPSNTGPTPRITTTSSVRCAVALNILQQRAHDERTVALVTGVMAGVTLAELVDFDVQE